MNVVCGYCRVDTAGQHETGCPVRTMQTHSDEIAGLRAYTGMLEREITDLRTALRRAAKTLEALTIILDARVDL